MSEGDKNTKFFHAYCNQRRQTNLIKGLRDGNGVWHTNKSKMIAIVVDYFQSIFTSSNPGEASINSSLEGLETIVTEEMNNLLLEDFTSDKVS